MKNTPVVSVIIPIYNVEKYLKRCVDSILAQTFTDYELILVDDGSPDGCGVICDEYQRQDNRIRVIHKENGGLSSARNAGLDVAQGKYVWFCDSDDYVDESLLYTMIPYMDNGYDVAAFQICKEDEENGVYYKSALETEDVSLDHKNRAEYIVNIFLGGGRWSCPFRVYRRDIIELNRLRFVDNKTIFAEDLCFTLCYTAFIHKTITIDEHLYYYWQRKESIMHQQSMNGNLERFSKLAEVVYEYWLNNLNCNELLDIFPLVYYRIVYPEILRIKKHNNYTDKQMKQYILQNIENKDFYKKNISKVLYYYGLLDHEKWDREYYRRKYELDYWNNNCYGLYCLRYKIFCIVANCRNFLLKCRNFLKYRLGLIVGLGKR